MWRCALAIEISLDKAINKSTEKLIWRSSATRPTARLRCPRKNNLTDRSSGHCKRLSA